MTVVTMSYTAAGQPVPASGSDRSYVFFKGMFDFLFNSYNTDIPSLDSRTTSNTATLASHTATLAAAIDAATANTLMKRDAGGSVHANVLFANILAGNLQGSAVILNSYQGVGAGTGTGLSIKGSKQDLTTFFDIFRVRRDSEGNAIEFAKRLYYDDAGAGTNGYTTWGSTDPAMVINKTWLMTNPVPPVTVEPSVYILTQSTGNTTVHSGNARGAQGLYINVRDHAVVNPATTVPYAGSTNYRGALYGLSINVHHEASRSDTPWDDTAAIVISMTSGSGAPAGGYKGTEAVYFGGGYWGDWIGADGTADIGIRLGGGGSGGPYGAGRNSINWYCIDWSTYGYTAVPTVAGGLRVQDGKRSAIRVNKALTPGDPRLDQTMISADGAGYVYLGSDHDFATPPVRIANNSQPSLTQFLVTAQPAQTGALAQFAAVGATVGVDASGNITGAPTISATTNIVSGGFIYAGPTARAIQIADADGFVTSYSQAVGAAYVSGSPATSIIFKGGSWYSGSTRLTLPQTTVTYGGGANANLVSGTNPTVPTTARVDVFFFDPVTNKVGFISGTDASSPTVPTVTSSNGAPALQVKVRSNVLTSGITPLLFGGNAPTDTGTNSFFQADLRTGGSPFNPFAQTVISNIVPSGVSTATTDATLAAILANGYTPNLPALLIMNQASNLIQLLASGNPVSINVNGSWRTVSSNISTPVISTSGLIDVIADTTGAAAGAFIISWVATGTTITATQRKLASLAVASSAIQPNTLAMDYSPIATVRPSQILYEPVTRTTNVGASTVTITAGAAAAQPSSIVPLTFTVVRNTRVRIEATMFCNSAAAGTSVVGIQMSGTGADTNIYEASLATDGSRQFNPVIVKEYDLVVGIYTVTMLVRALTANMSFFVGSSIKVTAVASF